MSLRLVLIFIPSRFIERKAHGIVHARHFPCMETEGVVVPTALGNGTGCEILVTLPLLLVCVD